MLSIYSLYLERHARAWDGVERYFGRLPLVHHTPALVVRNDLAAQYSGNGLFRCLLSRPQDHPMLYQPFWLLDDWAFPRHSERLSVESGLFSAAVLLFTAAHIEESILSDSATYTRTAYGPLSRLLRRDALAELAQIHEPVGSEIYSVFWKEFTAALSLRRSWRQTGRAILPVNFLDHGDRTAFSRIPAAAAAVATGHRDRLPELFELLRFLDAAWQLQHDLSNFRRDLDRGTRTAPVLYTIHAAGIDVGEPNAKERILGAFVLQGYWRELLGHALDLLDSSRNMADRLGLPSFLACIAASRQRIEDRLTGTAVQAPTNPIVIPEVLKRSPVGLEKLVFERAAGFLLSDAGFSEGIEYQRSTLQAETLSAQFFPQGLIVEYLLDSGFSLPDHLEGLLQMVSTDGFRYYRNAVSFMPPDADCASLFLRLLAFSPNSVEHRSAQQQCLHLFEINQQDSGEIPVWLTRITETPAGSEPNWLLLSGSSDLAVEANAILGMLACGDGMPVEVFRRACQHWMRRWQAVGLGGAHFYVPLYSLWTSFELLTRMRGHTLLTGSTGEIDTLWGNLLRRFETELSHTRAATPQDAAFLSLISLRPGAYHLFSPEWVRLLCKTQRYDGSWSAQPLYLSPNRAEYCDWYASRPVTTALCLLALKRYIDWKSG